MKNLRKSLGLLLVFTAGFLLSVFGQDGPNLYPVKASTGKYGFNNRTGELTIAADYDDALGFNSGLAAVKKDGKWGYIDETGTIKIACTYQDAWYFTEGLAAVKKDGKWGYIDAENTVKIEFTYQEAGDFSEGAAWVKKDDLVGFIDKKGTQIVDFLYDNANSFEDGLAAVDKSGKWGFIDKTGKVVIAFQFENAMYFDDNLAPVKKYGSWGFIDQAGNLIIGYTKSTITDNYKDYSFGWLYAENAYKLLQQNIGTSNESIYKEHLTKAIEIARYKTSYLFSSDWEKLANYYKAIGNKVESDYCKKMSK